MSKERDSMSLTEAPGFALEGEERSDEASNAPAHPAPDPEVVAKPVRRQFRVSAAHYRGSRSLHRARRPWSVASPRGLVQLASIDLAPSST